MNPPRLLVIDDSLTIRAMLEEILGRYTDAEIIGMASDGKEAVAMVNALLPDIILLDLKMPGLDGIGFLDAIRDHWHQMHVIIVSSAAQQCSTACVTALEHGAEACFDKARLVKCARELAMLIEDIAKGRLRPRAHQSDAVTIMTERDGHMEIFGGAAGICPIPFSA